MFFIVNLDNSGGCHIAAVDCGFFLVNEFWTWSRECKKRSSLTNSMCSLLYIHIYLHTNTHEHLDLDTYIVLTVVWVIIWCGVSYVYPFQIILNINKYIFVYVFEFLMIYLIPWVLDVSQKKHLILYEIRVDFYGSDIS